MVELLTDEIDFSSYMVDTEPRAKVLPAKTWVGDLKEKLRRNTSRKRVHMPWAKTFNTFEFRPGEMTVWGGVNGHGKSMLTTMVALGLMAQGDNYTHRTGRQTNSFVVRQRRCNAIGVAKFVSGNAVQCQFVEYGFFES